MPKERKRSDPIIALSTPVAMKKQSPFCYGKKSKANDNNAARALFVLSTQVVVAAAAAVHCLSWFCSSSPLLPVGTNQAISSSAAAHSYSCCAFSPPFRGRNNGNNKNSRQRRNNKQQRSFTIGSFPGRPPPPAATTATRITTAATSASLNSLSTEEAAGRTIESSISSSSTREEQIRIGRDHFAKYFHFPLDNWQLQAGGAIVQGHHVVVCSPTGAGKTVVGEMGLLHSYYEKNGKSIYTTPLKALSNQKYADLSSSAAFGKRHTGLATGDISLNKEFARVTVMTTEVYRNLAWRWQSSSASAAAASSPTSTRTTAATAERSLENTTTVVFDEFHYMGYPGRGSVWEESVITSPPHVQMIALSATLPNADQLSAWIRDVTQHPVTLVEVPTSQRPVPLRYLYGTKDGVFPLFRNPDAGPGSPRGLLGYRGDYGVDINTSKFGAAGSKKQQADKKPNNDSGRKGFAGTGHNGKKEATEVVEKLPRGLQVNPALKAAAEKRMGRVNRAIEKQRFQPQRDRYNDFDDDDGGARKKQRRRAPQPYRRLSPREERKERERLLKREMRKSVPSLSAVVQRLQQKELLPAIFFIFSRAGCEDAARTLFQQMRGMRHDPTRLLPGELEEFGGEQEEGDSQQDPKRKRKTRQRGRIRGDFIQDSDGRTFRSRSNYISEDLLQSLYEPEQSLDEEDFKANGTSSSPLSSDNWDFYSRAGLLGYEQVKEAASRIRIFNDDNPEIAFDDEIVEQYLFGVGCHHAGMLPAHKSFVEILYKKQQMKVVFATETLAAGINMPARTTVVCSLAKRGGDGSSMALLETSNLLQMAGRAGRRGMDTDGTCLILATPFEGHEEAAKILTDPIKPIKSQFSPSYSLAVNLIVRGEGKLDVAKQLVGKSFAMWEKRQADESIDIAVAKHGEGVSEVLQASAQENFVNQLIKILQTQVDKRTAKFDIARLQSLLDILNDRESLKKTSKSYLGAAKMLELEQTTLGYLEKELETLRSSSSDEEEGDVLGELLSEDEEGLLKQIKIQRKRAVDTEKDVDNHPFSAISAVANEIMAEETPQAKILLDSLIRARQAGVGEGDENEEQSTLTSHSHLLTARELSSFSKAAVVVRRKTRKLMTSAIASGEGDLDPVSLLRKAESAAEIALSDSWDDMRAIVKTLVAYGCLTTSAGEHRMAAVPSDGTLEEQVYSSTPAGTNLGMLGFDNSLWCLTAIGGAFDVVGASSKLDKFRNSMDAFDNDDGVTDWYDDDTEPEKEGTISKSMEEAETLVSQLRSLTPREIAGYVSSFVGDNSRMGGPSVVELFQRLTGRQQRVIQSALLVMERLVEVQKEFNVDEKTRNCNLDISNCEVVTAWAEGCSWAEALQVSGLPPGDLARVLSRALDALRQLGNLPFSPVRRKSDGGGSSAVPLVSPGIHPEIRRLCRDAATSINRYPVKDPLAFETGEESGDIEFTDDNEGAEDEIILEDDFDDDDDAEMEMVDVESS